MSRPIKRQRRTKEEMTYLRQRLIGLLSQEHPMTVRQVFYQMVSRGFIEKTESEYKCTIVRLLGELRDAGHIPFDWIADNTRWMRKPRTHSSLQAALEDSAKYYRRDLWDDQDAYVEIWLEKDALAGVLYEETEKWGVPLMVTRGYSSKTFLHSAAEAIQWEERPAYIYHFGDYDPSGLDIPRQIEEGLRKYAPDAEIHFDRVAVTREQISDLNLQTRPTKTTDSRARNFIGGSVEVDAIPPIQLREMVAACISQHVNEYQWEMAQVIEQQERETFTRIAESFGAGAG